MITNCIIAIVTAYTYTGNSCANTHYPIINKTIAAPRSIPLGSIVIVGTNIFIVEDRTNKKYDGRFDIFMGSKKECLK